jgi:FimV-like protein
VAAAVSAEFGDLAAIEQKALSKADSYMAYGRYRDAQAALMTALGKMPDSEALQLKLAECYASGGDAEDFARLQQRMVARGVPARHPQVWERILAMVGAAGAGAVASPEPVPELELPPLPEPALESAPPPASPPARPEQPPAAAKGMDEGSGLDLESFRLNFDDLEEADLQVAFPGGKSPAARASATDAAPQAAAGSAKTEAPTAAAQPVRSARLDQLDLVPGDPDMEVSLPLLDLDQQLGADGLGEDGLGEDGFDDDGLANLDLPELGAETQPEEVATKAAASEPSEELPSLELPDLDLPGVDVPESDVPELDAKEEAAPPRTTSALERASEAAKASRGVDPFEELVAAELGEHAPAAALDDDASPDLDALPDLDLSLAEGPVETAAAGAGSDPMTLELPDELPQELGGQADAKAGPANDLAADIEKFLAGKDEAPDDVAGHAADAVRDQDGSSLELENLDLDMSSEAGFHTQMIPSSAPPGQMPSLDIPELDMGLDDLDSFQDYSESPARASLDAPDVPDVPDATETASVATRSVSSPATGSTSERDSAGRGDSSGEEAPMFGDESLMMPDSGASDVLSSQWRMDSAMWDEVATKMDLAFAYIEMEDTEAARAILEEVIREGNEEQRAEAQGLLKKIT